MYELIFHNGRSVQYRKSCKFSDLLYTIELLDLCGMKYRLYYNCKPL